MSDSIDRRTWKPVDHETTVSLIGEGVHKGIRKGSEDPTGLWRAIADSGETWGEGLDFFVYWLESMGMALCEKVETKVDSAPTGSLPVEPGDLRAGDEIEYNFKGERFACVLREDEEGWLRSNVTPEGWGAEVVVVAPDGRLAGGISGVRLIESAARKENR